MSNNENIDNSRVRKVIKPKNKELSVKKYTVFYILESVHKYSSKYWCSTETDFSSLFFIGKLN